MYSSSCSPEVASSLVSVSIQDAFSPPSVFNTSTAYSLLYDRLLIALRSMAVHRIWSMVLGYFLHRSLLHLTRQLSREMEKKTINSIWCQYLGKKQWAKTLHHTMHYQNTIWKKNNFFIFYRKMI